MTDMFLPSLLSKARSARLGAGTFVGDLGTPVRATRRSWPRPRDSGPIPADSGARTHHGRRGRLPHSPWSAGRRRCPRRSSGRQGSQPRSAPGAGSCLRLSPATDAESGSCPGSAAASLPPSLRGGGRSWAATAAAPGARSRSRSAGARSSSRALAGKARRGRAAERAQRCARLRTCHSPRGPRWSSGATQGPRPQADCPEEGRAVHTLLLGSGCLAQIEPQWRRQHALAFPAWPVPSRLRCPPPPLAFAAHYASLGPFSRNIARLPAAKRGTAVKDSLFSNSLQISKWIRKRLV